MKENKIETIAFSKAYQICINDLEKHDKSNTISNYKYSISSLLKYIGLTNHTKISDLRPDYFSKEFVRGTMNWMVENKHSANSANVFLSNIRGIIKRICTIDPSFMNIQVELKDVKPIKGVKSYVPPLTESEAIILLRAPGNKTGTGLKYTTILTLASTSALRVSELINIKIRDIHINDKYGNITIIGKGNKKRIVTIANQAIPIIVEYIRMFHGEKPIDDSYLFYSVYNGSYKRMTRCSVSKQLKKYVIAAFGEEYEKKIHMHSLRHTGATAMNENGISIAQISKYLGHEKLETTMKYVKLSDTAIRESLKRASFSTKQVRSSYSKSSDILDLFKT